MSTLYDIYNNEEWLRLHTEVEDNIFVPAIRRLERISRQNDVTKNISSMVFKGGQDNGDALSEREKDVVVSLVQGMSNKEIAERMEYPVDKVKKVLKIAKEPISRSPVMKSSLPFTPVLNTTNAWGWMAWIMS